MGLFIFSAFIFELFYIYTHGFIHAIKSDDTSVMDYVFKEKNQLRLHYKRLKQIQISVTLNRFLDQNVRLQICYIQHFMRFH